jgi:hypothetical protein
MYLPECLTILYFHFLIYCVYVIYTIKMHWQA